MATPIGSFAGIGSGVKYTDLVNQLIQVESQPSVAMQARLDKYNARLGAYKSYGALLTTLETAAKALRDGTAFQGVTANVAGGTSASGRTTLSASASPGAAPGSYAVQVLQLAQAEKVSGTGYASATTALGLAGDFRLNGATVTVVASDTLTSIRDKINAANAGTAPSGVAAAIVTDTGNTQRLVLSSAATGASGINLVDGAQLVAQQLGWLDATQTLKHPTSAGAQSDSFGSSTAAIATQLGLTLAPGPQTVRVAGQTVTIDLGVDTLTSIASKLSALTGIQATVQTTTNAGATRYYLDVRNTTSFVDAGNALEQLGITVAGRSALTQQVQGGVMTAGNATTPATASTLLTSLWNGGSASGAKAGDTLAISGTRGDGTAVTTTFTIGASSTVQDLLTALNSATTGFGGGARPATASIDASGRITLTDGTAGQSSLSLQVVARNEGGGRLDLGPFAVSTAGRARQLVAGSDARLSVDGVTFTRSTNTVTDVIANASLSLLAADATATSTVTIGRSADAAQSAVQAYVDAYNKVVDFIKQQQTPSTDATRMPPLYGDTLLRLAQPTLSSQLLAPVAGTAPDLTTVGMVGVQLTKDGHLSLDTGKFQSVFATRYTDLQKLFMEQGSATNAAVTYLSSTAATQSGTYALNITTAATRATVLGTGFSGTYVDDATPDVMTVTDTALRASASVQLASGMTTAQIVAALNSAFTTQETRLLRSSTVLNDATGTTPASSATRLVDARQTTGASAGVVAGDTIGFSGLRPDGTSYSGTFTVAANSTFGDLTAQIQGAIGPAATVSFSAGIMTAQNVNAGSSQLTLALTPANQGGGTLAFGPVSTVQAGHGVLNLVASAVGNQLQIVHGSYGSAAGVQVGFTPGGANGTAQLGIAAGLVSGIDVQGTIGGFAATGTGQTLVGAVGTPVSGLAIAYGGSVTGAAGTVTLTQGAAAAVDRALNTWVQTGGTLGQRQDSLTAQATAQQRQLDSFSARMEIRRQALLKKYLAMDTAVQRLQAQGAAFLSALGGGIGAGGVAGA